MNNTSGKPGRLVTAAALVLALLGGCKNPIVQDILWGTASLDDITVSTDVGESFFQLSPGFNPDWTSYEVLVPALSTTVSVRASSRRASAGYRKIDTDGTVTENGSRDFDFPVDKEECTVEVTAGRSHADSRIYSIRIIRAAGDPLNNIIVKTRNGPGDFGPPLPFLPGYDPEKDETTTVYRCAVPAGAVEVRLAGWPGTGTTLRFHKTAGADADWKNDDSAEPAFPGATFSFPDTEENAVFEIEVNPPSPDTTKLYKVEIYRPGKVKEDPTSTVNFTIDGVDLGAPAFVYKNAGDTVSFNADPGWGNKITAIKYQRGGGSPVPIPLNSSNLYAVRMGEEDLVLSGTVIPIPPVTGVRYVKPGGSGTGNGSSWANASGNLQAMIDASSTGQEIWIARGTITPDWTGTSWYSTNSDKKNWAFVLKSGVAIYGGFKGTEESMDDKKNRDWKTNKTILSGSFGGVNAKHVVIAAGVGNSARLEGLTISGGLTTIPDGGDITINSESIGQQKGAGIYCINASPFLRNVTITGNNATNGAIFCEGSAAAPWFVGVTISGNSGDSVVYNNNGGGPRFIGCRIEGNGDGIKNNDNGYPVLINTIVSNNTGPGLSTANNNGMSILINSRVSGNLGDGVHILTYNVAAFYNTIVAGNTGIQVDAGAALHDSYAPGHAGSLPSAGSPGSASHYPLDPSGNLTVTGSPVYNMVNGLAEPFKTEVIEYLRYDINGNPRFIGTINLGPEEQ